MGKIEKLIKLIKTEIIDGKFGKIGARFITVRDFAQEYGVSYVSAVKIFHALSDEGYITLMNKWYVLSDVSPRKLTRQKLLIGVHIRALNNSFYTPLLNELTLRSRKYNMELIIMCSNNDLEEKKRILNRFIEMGCAGVVNLKSLNELDVCEFLRLYPLPMVMNGIDFIEGVNCTFITTDDDKTGQTAANHLLKSGCTVFASINTSTTSPEGDKRHEGFCRELGLNGFSCESLLYDEEKGFDDYYYWWGLKISELADRGRVGVFCRHDMLAIHLISICNKYNLKIPEQVSIVGYEDLDISKLCSPQLTTFSYSLKTFADELLKNLREQIRNPKRESKRLFVPTILVVRQTTMPSERTSRQNNSASL